MKYLNILFLFMAIGLGAQAQVTPKMVRADIKTPDATCTPCKTKIEQFCMKNIDGLVKINVQTSRKVTTVQFYPDRTNVESIKYYISALGFDADNMLANPDTYKLLPDCCKKPADQKNPPIPKN